MRLTGQGGTRYERTVPVRWLSLERALEVTAHSLLDMSRFSR